MLEMEMLSQAHEGLKWITGRFTDAFAEERSIDYEAAGSTTWHRQEVAGGLEADASYYIQNYLKVRGREVDLAVDPPPDLAIEIDLCRPDVEKAAVYARLGVPEIWRGRDRRLIVLGLQANGGYAELQRSIALPDFPLDELATALKAYPQTDSARAILDFRRRLRGRQP